MLLQVDDKFHIELTIAMYYQSANYLYGFI